jgi:hypothetical protein
MTTQSPPYKILLALTLFVTCTFPGLVIAAELRVQITNLTQGMAFMPRLLVAHTDRIDLFEAGSPATTPLTWMAEAGVVRRNQNATAAAAEATFEDYLQTSSRTNQNRWSVFGDLLAPATASAEHTFDTGEFTHLSMVAMLIPTNDAFTGLDSWPIPTTPGTYVLYLNAYDAGTEANDEINSLRVDVTGPAGAKLGDYGAPGVAGADNSHAANLGTGGTGVAIQVQGGTLADNPNDREGSVHVHRGVVGDTNPNGGISDLDSSVHRWLNPVARLTVIVPEG